MVLGMIRTREFPSSTVPYMQVVRKTKPDRGMDKKYPIKNPRDDEKNRIKSKR